MAPRTPLLALFALASACAPAQTVYRCGSSYSSQPCAGGAAIDVTDTTTAAAAARASKAAAEDWKRAEALEKARLAQEKNAPKALVIGPKEEPVKPEPKVPAKGHKDKKKGKAEDPGVFTAVGPKKKK